MMETEEQPTEQAVEGQNKPMRDEHGRLLPGHTANPNGRPPETEEKKAARRAIKEFAEEYRQKLAEALPSIEPVLIAKAIGGDIVAIKEVNDRVLGKPTQPLSSDPENPLSFNIISLGNVHQGEIQPEVVPDSTNPSV